MNALGISKNGDQILAIRRDFAAPLTVLPVQGGPARRLTEGQAYEEPLGWSADGKEVLFESTLDGENLLFFAPLDGGPMRQVKLPGIRRRDFSPVLSAGGNHVLYARDGGVDGTSRLEVSSIEEDSSWELSRRHALLQAFVTGAGGSVYRDGPDFIFLEKRDDRYELYRSSPRGPSRLLRSFAREEPQSVAVHGNRIAYVVNSKTGGSLFLASAGDAPTRRLLTLNGELHQATWSPSGTSIAAYHFDPTAASGNDWRPEGRDLITLGREAFLWFGILQPKEVQQRLDAFWEREDRFDSFIDVVLASRSGAQRTFHIHPLPHPSPLNSTWYKCFPDLLAARLRQLKVQPDSLLIKP